MVLITVSVSTRVRLILDLTRSMQLITDPRVWVVSSHLGTLIVHGHMGDSSTTDAIRTHFYLAWAAEFSLPSKPAELNENFTKIRHHRAGPRTVEMSCMGVIRQLEDLIMPYHP